MIKARKGNRVVRIPDEKANDYKALGYSLYNEKNEVIYLHVNDADKIASLEAEVKRLTAALAAATDKIEELTRGNAEANPEAQEASLKASGAGKKK